MNAIKDSDGYSFIPSISIFAAILATIANIILLIVFIHHIAISIQADKVISNISDFIAEQVNTLFPENMGEEKEDEDFDPLSAISAYKIRTSIKSPTSGYFQYMDSDGLMDVVAKQNSLLELNYRPGSYLVKGTEIAMFYSNKKLS